MKRAKKVVKLSETDFKKLQINRTHFIKCSDCPTEVEVDIETVAVLCWRCTTILSPPAPFLLRSAEEIEAERKEKSKFPPGWKFMKVFVLEDGTVYEKGEENSKLKGTLKATDVELLRQQRKAKKKTKKQKREIEDDRHEELVKNHKEKKKALKAARSNPSNLNSVPSVTTNREVIVANITKNDKEIFEAKEGGINYTALVNDQKKLKYVFNNSKKIMGKRQSDGTYKWRGCK